ncbi:MAG TPA: hypothetical protein VGN59_01780 [Acidimicrobiia bacterium]|jgi:hypothetical protein
MELSRPGLRAPVAVACAVVALALAACGGGGSDPKAAAPSPAGTKLTLTPGAVQVAAAGNPGTLSDADKTAIMATLRRYIVAATIDPLHGKPVGNLDQVFTPAALAALIGPNRDATVDDGVPKATSTVVAKNPPVPLTALSDPSGAIGLVGASLFLDVNAKASRGPVRILRTGDVVLSHDGGAWKITSYRLSVARTGTGLPEPTTSSTGSTAP